MAERNDISGLLRFIEREEVWRDRMADVLDEHLASALETFEIDHEDLTDILGEVCSGLLWGCAFEDFLGRRYDPDGQNIVDLYLKRHGWREAGSNREYFAELRDASVSLYEVSAVRPGESMQLRDMLMEAKPVTVHEKSATRSLKQWDKIAVRVVAEGDHHVISGALLPFSSDIADLLMAEFRKIFWLGKRRKLRLTPDQLREYTPLFTDAWLCSQVSQMLDPVLPEFRNFDDDEIMFHDLRFPLASGVTQKKVIARLDKVGELEPAGEGFWNWIAPDKKAQVRKGTGLVLSSQMVGGGSVLGTLEFDGKALLASVNSADRAARVEALVTEAAGDLLKRPLTAIRTVEQMLAENRSEADADETDEIPPEIARQIAHDYMDQHYFETLKQPLPMLDGKSPRQAIRTAAGRKKVVEWLKMLENRSARNGVSQRCGN